MSPMCVEATHDKIYLYKIINKYYIDNKDDALAFTMLVYVKINTKLILNMTEQLDRAGARVDD
jgi:hypothetical protein